MNAVLVGLSYILREKVEISPRATTMNFILGNPSVPRYSQIRSGI